MLLRLEIAVASGIFRRMGNVIGATRNTFLAGFRVERQASRAGQTCGQCTGLTPEDL